MEIKSLVLRPPQHLRPLRDLDRRQVTSSMTVEVEGIEYHVSYVEDHDCARYVPSHVLMANMRRGIMKEIEKHLFQGYP